MKKKQVILAILDGWGYREDPKDNAVLAANTPNFDKLWNEYPHALLQASGLAVGLPEGQMGNSEVGHTTLGAGSPVDTDLVRIGKSIEDGSFEENEVFLEMFSYVKAHNSVLHVQGLVSSGGVHSHIDHLVAFLKLCKKQNIEKVAIHVFTDGRDTPPQSAKKYLTKLERVIAEVGVGYIASMSGRFYAMDRDKNWDRVDRVAEAMFQCQGDVCQLKQPSVYLEELYGEGVVDEYVEPVVFSDGTNDDYKIKEDDAVFFFNFRADRARMLSQKVLDQAVQSNIHFVTLTQYDDDFECKVAFPPHRPAITLGEVLSENELTQAHIAETEKYAHVTYFFNGGQEVCYIGEEHIVVDSRKDIPTHDKAPKMRAEAITDKAIEQIEKGTDFVLLNFANPDMVGHTANVPAIIEGVEEVDLELGRLVAVTEKTGATLIVTADHGNAELNIDQETGEKHTAHTTNPVPVIINKKDFQIRNGGLADVAPMILKLFEIEKPTEMKGESLI